MLELEQYIIRNHVYKYRVKAVQIKNNIINFELQLFANFREFYKYKTHKKKWLKSNLY